MGAGMLCNVSESQGKPGLAGSEQKPGRKPGMALPSETQGDPTLPEPLPSLPGTE